MPREIVHWYVVDETIKQLPECLVKKILLENQSILYLGAMAHDAPYYLSFGRSQFLEVAERLHGADGENTAEPLYQLLEAATKIDDSQSREAVLAFILGMFSHAITDVTFHPLVYYFTGDYYDPDTTKRNIATTKHREYEVLLDLYFKKKMEMFHAMSFNLSNRDSELRSISNIFEQTGLGTAELWLKSLKWMTNLQKLFIQPQLGLIAFFLKTFYPKLISTYEALFTYSRTKQSTKIFNNKLNYKNPVSGEEFSHSVDELALTASKKLLEIYLSINPYLKDRGMLEKVFQGESLNSGLIGSKKEDFSFFLT
jgi:hypothetical protein